MAHRLLPGLVRIVKNADKDQGAGFLSVEFFKITIKISSIREPLADIGAAALDDHQFLPWFSRAYGKRRTGFLFSSGMYLRMTVNNLSRRRVQDIIPLVDQESASMSRLRGYLVSPRNVISSLTSLLVVFYCCE